MVHLSSKLWQNFGQNSEICDLAKFAFSKQTRGPVGHILDGGIVTGALKPWCRLGMKTRVTAGSHLEIKLDAE